MKAILIGHKQKKLQVLLEKQGFRTEVAKDFTQVEHLNADIIITELKPLLRAKPNGKGTPILCYTRNEDEYSMLSAMNSGASTYLNVTNSHQTLLFTVNSLLKKTIVF